MPRKKAAKRQQKSTVFAIMQKMEKEFHATPVKLSAYLNKDINNLKQVENKIKNAMNKAKNQIKNSENRVKTAAERNTAAGKKLWNKAKKAHSKILKSKSALDKQLSETTKLLEAAMSKNAKMNALRKHLSQFEKEWHINAKKQKSAHAQQKVKKTAAKRKARAADMDMEPVSQPQAPIFDSATENMSAEEKADIVS